MQNKEIELKFGFIDKKCNLHDIFSSIGEVTKEQVDHLENTYFDTDTKDLFAIKAGLRIRRADKYSEQTLKIKGENIGGLHQRSEYNVDIDKDATTPNLKLFPKEATESLEVEKIEPRLKSLCKINFTRKMFNLKTLDSVFEVAHDVGYIEFGQNEKYPINEIELELKETQVKDEDLLKLFSVLCTSLANAQLPLLLEPFSKMHRASLLQDHKNENLNLSSLESIGSLVTYLTGLVSSFEKTYGYFILSKDAIHLSLFNVVLKRLINGLKCIKKKHVFAFIDGKLNKDYDHQHDLKIILKLLKSFYKTTHEYEDKLLKACLKQNQNQIDNCISEIREQEKSTKMFLIPLKLRVLLSLVA